MAMSSTCAFMAMKFNLFDTEKVCFMTFEKIVITSNERYGLLLVAGYEYLIAVHVPSCQMQPVGSDYMTK